MKVLIALLIALGCLALPGVQSQDTVTKFAFTRMDVMVTMRDGTQLFTVVMRPTAMSGPLPFLMMRTPYGAESRADALAKGPIGVMREFVEEGYIFVFQDIRGRYRSGGNFVMTRPAGSSPVDETTDT